MPTDLTGFDYVVLTLIGLLALLGFVRGLTQEALSLGAWIAGGIVVRFFHEPATAFLVPHTGGDASAAIIAFLVLFFGTVILGRILAGMAGGASRRSALGAMDRVLGLGFGAVKGVLLAAIIFLLAQFATGLFDPRARSPDWLMNARVTPLLQMSANTMVNWVKELQEPATATPARSKGKSRAEDDSYHSDDRERGYSEEDRRALDELLAGGEGVDI